MSSEVIISLINAHIKIERLATIERMHDVSRLYAVLMVVYTWLMANVHLKLFLYSPMSMKRVTIQISSLIIVIMFKDQIPVASSTFRCVYQ